MDGRDFDALTRSLSGSGSRRRMVAGLAAGVLGLVGLRSAEAASCRAAGNICRENANCCSGLCGPKDRSGRRRCHCQSLADCPAPDQCRAATCDDGICGEEILVGQDCTADACTCTAGGSCGGASFALCGNSGTVCRCYTTMEDGLACGRADVGCPGSCSSSLACGPGAEGARDTCCADGTACLPYCGAAGITTVS
jgi:hypothetical protein